MAPTRRHFLGAVTAVGATGLAGCSDGDPGGGTDGPDTTRETEPSPTATPTEADGGPGEATVLVRSHAEQGDVLVDRGGRTLYMFDRDEQGGPAIACTGSCTNTWQPLTVDDDPAPGENVTAEIGTVRRTDGTRQVTADGWPLYYFGSDDVAGEIGGQGVDGDWWVLGPDGTPKREEPPDVTITNRPGLGDVLVDGEGRTVYMFDADTRGGGETACTGDCVEAWPPLTVEGPPEAGENVAADLGTVQRPDGSTQATANGWPLYYYANDTEPEDTAGHGVNDQWWVLAPDGEPRRPVTTVRVRTHPEHGDVLVDGDGMTLYAFDQDERGVEASACTGDCRDTWPPLTAEGEPVAGGAVSADLGVFERADGSRQVTAEGRPVYYFAGDAAPGDATGHGTEDDWWVLGADGSPKRDEAEPTEGDGA